VWPQGGEIDTFEGVNNVTSAQMGLHTEPGCTQAGANQTSKIVDATDCDSNANNNQGCVTRNPDPIGYGAPLAAGGGGVWVTEFASSGIS
jgi:hypothetical protein